MSSRKKEAFDIRNWITHDVMPSIRRHGEYKSNSELKKQIDELNSTIDKQKNEIGVLKHNIKKTIFKKGKIVYLLRTIEITVDLDTQEVIYVKFGRTKNKARKATYDTCTKNKVQVLKEIEVEDAKNIEHCVLKKMENYRVSPRKEYFECTYNDIITQIASCIKFYENKNIDLTPDVEYDKIQLSRSVNFNENKKVLVKFFDAQDNIVCDVNDKDDSDSETDGDDEESEDDEIVQKGGNDNMYYDYIRYKLKYLQLKFDLM